MHCLIKHPRWSKALGWLILSSIQLGSSLAWGAPGQENQSAAASFDAGVKHFEGARYEEAVRAFLKAHELVPSADALANALLSAREANSLPLAAEVATHVLDSSAAESHTKEEARSLLADALPQIVRLHLSCMPEPCDLTLEGQSIRPGRHFVNPGTYRVDAWSAETDRREERSARFEAGTEHEISFDLTPQLEAPPAPVSEPPAPTHDRGLPADDGRAKSVLIRKETISYAAVASTAVLAGVTAWSGLDALRYRQTMGDFASQEEADGVRHRIQRTDLLLGVSVASALATTAWFVWGTDIKTASGETKLNVVVRPTGADLSVRGSFL